MAKVNTRWAGAGRDSTLSISYFVQALKTWGLNALRASAWRKWGVLLLSEIKATGKEERMSGRE
jgi:hypothetical protein